MQIWICRYKNVVWNAEGAAYYVCNYICKSVLKNNPSLTKAQRLLKIGCCVLSHEQVSAQAAAYRLGNMRLIHCSRKTVFCEC